MAAPMQRFLYRFSSPKTTELCCLISSNTLNRKFSGTGPPAPTYSEDEPKFDKDGFRILRINGTKSNALVYQRTKWIDRVMAPRIGPREAEMDPDQDWTDVWPAAASFSPSVIPLPIRQGFVDNKSENDGIIPYKYHNSELVKIPNFFHLTPRHIKKHCAAMRKFCSPWPRKLNDEAIKKHFPVQVTTTDYILSGPYIADPRARSVTMVVDSRHLELNDHSRDKFRRLLAERIKGNGKITIMADKCPLKSQNMQYAKYLLTAAYFEAWKLEDWETGKTREDEFEFKYEGSFSKERISTHISPHTPVDQTAEKSYSDALESLYNNRESKDAIDKYAEAVKDLLHIKTVTKNVSPVAN